MVYFKRASETTQLEQKNTSQKTVTRPVNASKCQTFFSGVHINIIEVDTL